MKQTLLAININHSFMEDLDKFDQVFSSKKSYEAFYAISLQRDLSSSQLKKIFAHLNTSNSVKSIKFSNNSRDYDNLLQDKLVMLHQTLKHNKSIEHIDLTGNWLKKGHVNLLAKILKSNHHISGLKLSDTSLTNKKIKVLANKIHVSKLEELDLSHNSIKAEGMNAILSKFQLAKNVLEILDLSYNYTGNQLIKSVSSIIDTTEKLKVLSLANNNFNDQNIAKLSDVLSKSKCLYSLDISGNTNLGLGGFYEIINLIKQNSNLVQLNIAESFSKIGSRISIAKFDTLLARALLDNQTIIDCGVDIYPQTMHVLKINNYIARQGWNSLKYLEPRLINKEQYKVLKAHNRKVPVSSLFEDLNGEFVAHSISPHANIGFLMGDAISNIIEMSDFIDLNNIHHRFAHESDSLMIKDFHDQNRNLSKAIVYNSLDSRKLREGLSWDLQRHIYEYCDIGDFSNLCIVTFRLLHYACRFVNHNKAIKYQCFRKTNMFFDLEAYFVNYYMPDSSDETSENLHARLLYHFILFRKNLVKIPKYDDPLEPMTLKEIDANGAPYNQLIDNESYFELDMIER
ncbi:MAG: hypothetical protein SFT68_05345 [Rickettsiaceae bacterium]|nr:hypothetical protein [Rickettsiaceae bacterium]